MGQERDSGWGEATWTEWQEKRPPFWWRALYYSRRLPPLEVRARTLGELRRREASELLRYRRESLDVTDYILMGEFSLGW